ncbi:MAG: amidohydrolase family protein [Bryobacteraceae bacterium]
MRGGFRIFDTHAHLGAARHSGRTCSAGQMLAQMDASGIDRSLLIPFPVVDDYRQQHDEIAAAVREYPSRLSGAVCLNPFLPRQEFLDEVRRCVEELGFRAIKLQPQYHGLNPVSPRSDFLFEAAIAHRIPVIWHTGSGAPFALPSLLIAPARRFPDLAIVAAHCGGSVYFLEAIVAAGVCPNLYLELSSLMPHHILEVMGDVPASRLMIGSDLPESADTEISKIIGLPITDEQKSEVLCNTGVRLFGH